MHDLKFYSEIFFRALPVGLIWAAIPVFGSSPPLRDTQGPGYCCHPGPRFSQPETLEHEKLNDKMLDITYQYKNVNKN